MIDILWVLLCSGLVFLMQAGFMCLESGLTRSKNSINVAVKNLADFGLSASLYWAFGYAWMMGNSISGWIGSTGFLLSGDAGAKTIAFFIFQTMFCGTAVTIVSGAVAERMRFKAYLLVALLLSGLLYPLFGHWAWNGLEQGVAQGWLGKLGFVDFAGSTVVHSTGAWVALATLLVIGARRDRFPKNGFPRKIHGANLPLSVLGCILLWLGWFGFNGGSVLAFNGLVVSNILNTIIAGTAGMITAGALGWWKRGLFEAELLINGSIAGLVAITAACHAVTTPIAAVIGSTGAAVMILVTYWLESWKIDDVIGAVAVHGGAGIWGTLSVALFGQPELLDTGLSRGHQLLVQSLGILVCGLWSFGMTWLILRTINRFFPLRVSAADEELGLNLAEHGAKTEAYDLFRTMDQQAVTHDLSLRAPVEPFTEVGHIATRYNQVMASLEDKNHQVVDYLQQVEQITTAAIAVENHSFQLGSLDTIAQRNDGLGNLAFVFQKMVKQIQAREDELAQTNAQLDLRVQERTRQLEEANALITTLNRRLRAENRRMGAELGVARQMQQMILPKPEELTAIAELDIAGYMEPADEVGGDYYDVLVDDETITVGIGDVTGHGFESGLVMLMTQTAIRTLKESQELDPVRFLDTLNRTIYNNVQRMGIEKDLTLAVLNYAKGKLWVSGQHEETLIIRQGGTIEHIDTMDLGLPLGLDTEITDFIGQAMVKLKPGDGVVVYTDGVTEAPNPQGLFYGLDQLCTVLKQNWQLSAEGIKRAVIKDLRDHIGETPVLDDITLVVLKQR